MRRSTPFSSFPRRVHRARNALAKHLKSEGRTLDAERVKALAKPPAPAWAVNQLYWQDPKAIERLLTLASAFARHRPDSSRTPICASSSKRRSR